MIIRSEKNKNYTTICNLALNDPNLSLKAKGLWAFIMTKPDEWKVSYRGLSSQLKEGQTAILKAMKELEDACYLTRGMVREEGGRFSQNDCTVYETPCVENIRVDSLRTKVNTEQVNTDTPTECAEQAPPSPKENSSSPKEKKEPTILKLYYDVLKAHDILVTNNNHVRSWAKKLEEQTGYDNAVRYLTYLLEIDFGAISEAGWNQNQQNKAFVPTLNTPFDIIEKRSKFRNCLEKSVDLVGGIEYLPRVKR